MRELSFARVFRLPGTDVTFVAIIIDQYADDEDLALVKLASPAVVVVL